MNRPDTDRRPAAERREQIEAVAYQLFSEMGYEDVTMTAVAGKVGVTKPIIYRHFGSKEGLYAACAARLVDTMLKEVGGAARREPTADRQLWAGILAQLRFIDANRAAWRVFVREAGNRGGVSNALLSSGRQKVTGLLADLIAIAARTAGTPEPPLRELEAMAHALQGAVEQTANWWEANPGEPPEAVALRVMNFAWQGFGSMVEGRFWVPPPLSDDPT